MNNSNKNRILRGLFFGGLIAITVCLVSCGAARLPMDDAYHISSNQSVTPTATAQTPAEPTPAEQTPTQQPTIVYTNVQDTTVTAVIRK